MIDDRLSRRAMADSMPGGVGRGTLWALDPVGRAVAVLVAQRCDAALRPGLAQGHVDVAVVAHRDMARAPDPLGEHPGIEPLGHANAGVPIHGRVNA
jgi:hypothetical protein